MLTLKDLSSYDIKNVDVKKISQTLFRRKDYLSNLAVVCATIFAIVQLANHQKLKNESVKQEITVLEQKVKAISEFETAKAEAEKFTASLPQGMLETNSIVDKINNLALARNIQILSYDPAKRSSADLYIKTDITLTFVAENFGDLGRFIADVENSEYNFRVERWAGNTNLRIQGRTKPLMPGEFNVEMTISCIYFKK